MEFKQAVVTQNGRALMAKLLAGKSTQFTKIKVSSTIYPDAQLANLTALTNIKQETTAQAYGNNTATVSVVGAIENTGLATGYYINTVGLYAVDPDKGEILYSVSSASVNGYMPPDTGVSKSGFEFKIYTEVGNATKVDLTVDPAAFATHEDIERVSTLKTAYSWSLDGKDRFSNVYPNENLVINSIPYELPTLEGGNAWLKDAVAMAHSTAGYSVIKCLMNVDWYYFVGQYGPANLLTEDFLNRIRGKKVVASADVLLELNGTALTAQQVGIAIYYWNSEGHSWTPNTRKKTYGFERISVEAQIPIDCSNILIALRGYNETGSIWKNAEIVFKNLKLEVAENEPTIYTPAPSDDYENAYPNYIGLAPGYSDKPEDYVWLPEPNKNQKKLDELIELKDQVADMQSWIQAHS